MSFKVEGILALFFYCCSSIVLTLFNKAVLSSANFHMNFLLLSVQAFSSVFLLQSFRLAGLVKFRSLQSREVSEWFPVSMLLIIMIYTSTKTLQYLTVAMFTVFKNLTIILVALGEQCFFSSTITRLMWLSFLLMAASSIVGGYNDLTFSLAGYSWMALNAGSSAAYLLYMKRTIKKIGFADFDSSYYSNAISLPVLLFLTVMLEDWRGFVGRLTTSSASDNMYLLGGMSVSGLAGFMISFATAWSVRVVTSTTFSMVGALNKLPVALSGMLFFKSERKMVNAGFVSSIMISFTSGVVYSVAQIMKNKQKNSRIGVDPLVEEGKGSDEPLIVISNCVEGRERDEFTSPFKRVTASLRDMSERYESMQKHRSYDLLPMSVGNEKPSGGVGK